jgi:hypothetical protein
VGSVRRQGAGGRGQEAAGIPINKFRGFNKDAVFLLPRGDTKPDALYYLLYIFLCFS